MMKRATQANDEDELLTIKEVMKYLKVSQSTIYRLFYTKKLSSVTFGRQRRVYKSALNQMLAPKPQA
jgi:excisionase family DNA binding protein